MFTYDDFRNLLGKHYKARDMESVKINTQMKKITPKYNVDNLTKMFINRLISFSNVM